MSSIKTVCSFLSVAIITIAIALTLTGCDSEETKAAKESFQNEVNRLQTEYDALQSEIDTANQLVTTEERMLDESLKPALEDAISTAKTVEFSAPNTPSGETEKVNEATKELKSLSFTPQLKELKDAEKALSDSIEQWKLVDNPSEEFVIERLRGVKGVGEISAVTEDNDPNGQLNKAGGYTATVYFTSPWVDQENVYGTTVIEKGTQGGGGIEVYANEEDALDRNSYLAAFDGSGMLSPGSHTVVGTIVVRTSDELTASQQKKLEEDIIQALTKLPE